MENGDNGQQKSGNSKETVTKKTSPTAQISPLIQEADDFTHKWTTGETVVDYERAKTLTYTTEDGTNFLGRPKKRTEPFCNALGYWVACYQLLRDVGTTQDRYDAAFHLMSIVQRGRAFNAFRDAKQQQRDYEREIENLKERINNLLKLNNELALENKRLHNLLPNAPKGKGDTEVGEVSE